MTDTTTIDFDNLSDDELRNLDLAELHDSMMADTAEEVEATLTTPSDAQNTSDTADDDQQEADADGNAQADTDEDGDVINQTQSDDAPSDGEQSTEQTVETDEQSAENKQAESVDYKAFYDSLTKPFKANGKEIHVTSPEDMIALMQQGANYSKKMAQLKPNLNAVRLLEQHGLMDKEKLGYLIDLHDKKPEAIAKLIKDADIDLYSFDTEQAEGYTPKQVNEPTEIESVLNELYDTSEKFGEVVKDISANWDEKSKETLNQNPELLYALAQQAENGMYEQIINALEYERMLGRMVHTPNLEAYAAIEARILAANQVQQDTPKQFTAPRPAQSDAQTITQASQVNDKKRKAMTPKSAGNSQVNDFDPLKMSDAEFLKFYEQQQFH